MQENEIQRIEQACTRLVLRFALLNDCGHHEELVALFAEDAAYARPTDPDNFVHGKEAILAAFKARPPGRLTRHLVSNVVVDVKDAVHARGVSYVVLYTGSSDKRAEKLDCWQADPRVLVGEFHDEFVLTPAGWRFARRQGRLVFAT